MSTPQSSEGDERSATLGLTIDSFRSAAAVIKPEAVRTPVLVSSALDRLLGATVLCKAESRQRSGSFKFRGAFHRLSIIPESERGPGVVAVSSGNHGAAVALSARLLGMPAVVYVPADAPAAKVALIQQNGGTVIRFDRSVADREAAPRAEAERLGATFVHPFEDRGVILGQGTTALEFHEQVGDLDALLVPMSGGGLMAGCASVTNELAPGCALIGVEPEAAADTQASFEAGEIVSIDAPVTIADGLAVRQPGAMTFAINRRLVDRVITTSEDEIADAMRLLHDELDLVIEPSGAAVVGALLSTASAWQGRRIGVVLSGGNVDPAVFAELVSG